MVSIGKWLAELETIMKDVLEETCKSSFVAQEEKAQYRNLFYADDGEMAHKKPTDSNEPACPRWKGQPCDSDSTKLHHGPFVKDIDSERCGSENGDA